MLARLSAFVIWALVAATAVFWGLRLFVRTTTAPPYTVAVGETTTARGDLTRLLGATPVNAPVVAAAPEAASRFRLLGIVAPRGGSENNTQGRGVALIAVDGKMPRAYSVGAPLDGDLTLQAVSLRTVSIGGSAGGAPITLELPLPTPPATGTLPTGGTPVPQAPFPVASPGAVPQPGSPFTPPPPMQVPTYTPRPNPASITQ